MLTNIENIVKAHQAPEHFWEMFKVRQPEVAALAMHVPRTAFFQHMIKTGHVFKEVIGDLDSLEKIEPEELTFLAYDIFSSMIAVLSQMFSERDLIKLISICPYSFFNACAFVYDTVTQHHDEAFSSYMYRFKASIILNTFHYAYPVNGLKEAIENYIDSMEVSPHLRASLLQSWNSTYSGQKNYLVH